MERPTANSGPHDRNVIRLDDRVLGACFACARPIHFADNYLRMRGAPVHLSCALVAARTLREDAKVPATTPADPPQPLGPRPAPS